MTSSRDDCRIRAKIKSMPDDFIVREIMPDGKICGISDMSGYPKEGECLHLILKKSNIDQFKAVSFLASDIGVPKKNINICGTKDKKAITYQRISVCGADKDSVAKAQKGDIELEYIGKGQKLEIGNLYGNRFEIVLRDIGLDKDELKYRLKQISRNPSFPNYFGVQRFGLERPISHIIGKHVIKGDYRSAVLDYICRVFPDESDDIKKARKTASKDMKEALDMFPKPFFYERVMMFHLLENPGKYKEAFERLPFGLQKMMVHAYQSYLFNKILEMSISKGLRIKHSEIPLFGFGMKPPKDRRLLMIMRDVLKEEDISVQLFRDNVARELGSKGGRRQAFEKAQDFRIEDISEDDINKGKLCCRIAFSLKKGTYATTFLENHFDIFGRPRQGS